MDSITRIGLNRLETGMNLYHFMIKTGSEKCSAFCVLHVYAESLNGAKVTAIMNKIHYDFVIEERIVK